MKQEQSKAHQIISRVLVGIVGILAGFGIGILVGWILFAKLGTGASEAPETTEVGTATDSDEESTKEQPETTPVQTMTEEISQTEETNEEATESETAFGEIQAIVNETGSWGEDIVTKQYSVLIHNAGTKAMNGWSLEIALGADATIESSWSGEFAMDGETLVITPAEFNTTVEAGQSIELGFIASNVTGDASFVLTSGDFIEEGSASQVELDPSHGNQTGDNSHKEAANALPVPEPSTDDWLYTDGRDILDADGRKVWITGVNWFGYNTGTNLFDGLWAGDLNTSIQSIADHGFNLVRIPMSAELILQWKAGKAPTANFNQATNDYLVGMDSLEIWDYVIGQFRACGLKIMIDIHSAETDASGHNINLWTTSKITTAQYQEALVWMAERYKNDDTILAYDLKNEPHGKPYEGAAAAIWNDSKADNNWKYVAQETALKVLKANPNVLIMVEGTEIYPVDTKKNDDYHSTDEKDYYFNWWGGNLRGVKDYPIDLGRYQNKLVYSPHDYGPTVYEQPWFKGSYDFDSLMKDCWKDNWFYIYETKTAPLLIGEWGGFMKEPNLTWMTYMRELIQKNHLNHTFWCFNANSGDTGGLVLDDFTTWDTAKYDFVKEVLWQQNGHFVGLDHEIPLGPSGNGITLSEIKK